MPASGEQLSQISEDFRAKLVIGAADQAIPSDLRPDQQRSALNTVIAELEQRREALVIDKIVRQALEDFPVADSYPEREQTQQ